MRLIDADELKDKLETFVLYRGNAFLEVTDILHKVDECKTIDLSYCPYCGARMDGKDNEKC